MTDYVDPIKLALEEAPIKLNKRKPVWQQLEDLKLWSQNPEAYYAKEKKKIVKSEDPVPRKIDTPKRKVTAPSQVPKPPINKKIFHGKPVAIDVEDLSKGIINPAPVVVKAPDFRKKVDPDLLKGVGYLLGSIPEDFKNRSKSRKIPTKFRHRLNYSFVLGFR